MADQEIRVGQQIGHYRLTQLLGKGGFAEVYLGEHIHLGTLAAVKLLHAQLGSEEAASFQQEARTIGRLIHPHIVRVLDFGLDNGTPFLVMDHAPNGTLRQRYPRGTRIPLAAVVTYARQVAEALQYAHDQRLVHRDIKPENMLLGRSGEVLLSDFGIALASQSSRYQSPQDVAGTIAYMAPEQIQAQARPASDQYALGIVVYEWLCGYRPFQGTYTEIAVKHALTTPPSLRTQLPTIPPAVEQTIMLALHKDPYQRFPTIQAFAQALEQASQQGYYTQAMNTFQSPYVSSAPPSASTSIYYPQPSQPPPSTRPPAAFPGYLNTPTPITPPPTFPETSTNLSTQTPPPQLHRNLTRRALLIGAVGLASIGGAAITYAALSNHSPQRSRPSDRPDPAPQPSAQPTRAPLPVTALITYKGHTDYLWCVAWSPAGRYIASGSTDGTAQIWDAQSGQRLFSYRSQIQPPRENDWARSLSWSPDGKRLLIGFFGDGSAQIVDIASQSLQSTVTPFQIGTMAVSWSPNGQYIAAGGTNNTVIVYEAATRKVVMTYAKHSGYVQSLSWSSDSQKIVSGSYDGTAKVWQVLTGQTLLNYTHHRDNVLSVSWSHNGKRIASSSNDGTAQIWDAQSGQPQLSYTKHHAGTVSAVAWSHDDTLVASGGTDANTHVWEPDTGNLLHTYTSMPIYGVSWSPDDTRIVTADIVTKEAQVWQVK